MGESSVIETAVTAQQIETRHQPRIGDRRELQVPGRLTWRDGNGALRFVSVVTRDVSDVDVYVECQTPTSIPLYRLVNFQVERAARTRTELPLALRQGRILSAVYRVGRFRPTTGTPHGYALRLLVEPCAQAREQPTHRVSATLH